MRLEMPENMEFRENFSNFQEIRPASPLAKDLNFNQTKIKKEELIDNKKIDEDDARFGKLARELANIDKQLDSREFKRDAVIFQQEIIKDILEIKGDNLRNPLMDKKALAEAKKYWENYDKRVMRYVGRFEDEKDQQAVLAKFEMYKVAIQGSLAAIRFFEEKGFAVKFPMPDEDIFKQCDLVFEKTGKRDKDYNLAVQLKGYKTSAKNSEETRKESEKIFSADYYDLADKDHQESFAKLRTHCLNLSRKTGKNYFPIFMNMPVSIDAHNPKKNEPTKYPLIDERGFIKPGQLKPTLDTLWAGYDRLLTKRNK